MLRAATATCTFKLHVCAPNGLETRKERLHGGSRSFPCERTGTARPDRDKPHRSWAPLRIGAAAAGVGLAANIGVRTSRERIVGGARGGRRILLAEGNRNFRRTDL